ncbi:MAG: hypothetical protein ACRC10_07395 [Thermoguttaceae bacterium]
MEVIEFDFFCRAEVQKGKTDRIMTNTRIQNKSKMVKFGVDRLLFRGTILYKSRRSEK